MREMPSFEEIRSKPTENFTETDTCQVRLWAGCNSAPLGPLHVLQIEQRLPVARAAALRSAAAERRRECPNGHSVPFDRLMSHFQCSTGSNRAAVAFAAGAPTTFQAAPDLVLPALRHRRPGTNGRAIRHLNLSCKQCQGAVIMKYTNFICVHEKISRSNMMIRSLWSRAPQHPFR